MINRKRMWEELDNGLFNRNHRKWQMVVDHGKLKKMKKSLTAMSCVMKVNSASLKNVLR